MVFISMLHCIGLCSASLAENADCNTDRGPGINTFKMLRYTCSWSAIFPHDWVDFEFIPWTSPEPEEVGLLEIPPIKSYSSAKAG